MLYAFVTAAALAVAAVVAVAEHRGGVAYACLALLMVVLWHIKDMGDL